MNIFNRLKNSVRNVSAAYTAKNRHLTARTGTHAPWYRLVQDILSSRERATALPWLTPQRARDIFEAWRRGETAEPQLIWEQMEQYDETLFTVLRSRLAALKEMPWNVLPEADAVGNNPERQTMADRQAQFLKTRLDAVENLREAIVNLGMADFRGYAALEITGNERRMRWETIEPWCLCRPNRRGQWLYNENADPVPAHPEEIDREAVIIRESMPIDLPAMFLICAKHHSVMAWDAFLDTFGIPNILISMPPNTTEEQAQAFDLMAQKLIGEGRGTLPNGADVKTVETAQNNTENFHSRAKWCNEAIITLATGGTLTVTSAPDSGTLAGSAHTDSFERLCAGTARDISETVNAQFCRRILREAFPDEPILARFTLAPEPADERLQQAQILATLRQAGWKPTAETVEEMMHFPVEEEQLLAPGNEGTGNAFAPIANSSPAEKEEDPPSASPLTPEEINIFQSLAGGINQEVLASDTHTAETALTAAVQGNGIAPAHPLQTPAKNTESPEEAGEEEEDATEEEISNNRQIKRDERGRFASTGASIHTQKGGRASRGNPKAKTTQSNTPLKAAPGAKKQKQIKATEHALKVTEGGGGVVKGSSWVEKKRLDVKGGSQDTGGSSHVKNTTSREIPQEFQ